MQACNQSLFKSILMNWHNHEITIDSHQTHFYRERVGSIRQGIPHLQTLMFIEMMQVSGIIVW